MTYLHVIDRELRVAARRGAVHRTRFVAGLFAVLIVGWFLYLPTFNSPTAFSSALFKTLSVIAYFVAALGGIAATADCLSEERREGTLGLLFLTELRGVDVVLGKLAATSLGVIYALLAMFPILAIAILSGGVSLGEFGQVVLAAVNLLFFSLCLGMFTSVICRDGHRSFGVGFALLAFFMGGFPLCVGLLHEWFGTKLESWQLCLSPSQACALALDDFGTGLDRLFLYYLSLITVHALGWICLITAMVRVGKSWQDQPKKSREKGLRRWWHGDAKSRESFRRRLLDVNAYFWRSAIPQHKPKLVWMITLGIMALFALGCVKYPNSFREEGAFFFFGFLLNSLLKLWMAIEAPRSLSDDRQSGALELLLVTPLSESGISHGLSRALWRQFAGPTLAVTVFEILLVATWPVVYQPASASMETYVLLFSGLAMLYFDLVTLAMLTPALAIKTGLENRAVLSSVLMVLGLPWLLWFATLSIIGLARFWSSLPIREEWMFLGMWLVLSSLTNLKALSIARKILPGRLRAIAASPYDRGKARQA